MTGPSQSRRRAWAGCQGLSYSARSVLAKGRDQRIGTGKCRPLGMWMDGLTVLCGYAFTVKAGAYPRPGPRCS